MEVSDHGETHVESSSVSTDNSKRRDGDSSSIDSDFYLYRWQPQEPTHKSVVWQDAVCPTHGPSSGKFLRQLQTERESEKSRAIAAKLLDRDFWEVDQHPETAFDFESRFKYNAPPIRETAQQLAEGDDETYVKDPQSGIAGQQTREATAHHVPTTATTGSTPQRQPYESTSRTQPRTNIGRSPVLKHSLHSLSQHIQSLIDNRASDTKRRTDNNKDGSSTPFDTHTYSMRSPFAQRSETLPGGSSSIRPHSPVTMSAASPGRQTALNASQIYEGQLKHVMQDIDDMVAGRRKDWDHTVSRLKQAVTDRDMQLAEQERRHRGRLDQQQRELNDANAKAMRYGDEVARLREELHAMNQQVKEYESTQNRRLSDLKQELSGLRNRYETSSRQLREMKDDLSHKNSEIGSLKSRLGRKDDLTSDLKRQADATKREVESMQALLDAQKKHTSSLSEQTKKAEEMADKARKETDRARREVADLRSERDRLEKEMAELEARNKELQGRTRSTERKRYDELSEFKRLYDSAKTEMNGVTRALDERNRALRSVNSIAQTLLRKIDAVSFQDGGLERSMNASSTAPTAADQTYNTGDDALAENDLTNAISAVRSVVDRFDLVEAAFARRNEERNQTRTELARQSQKITDQDEEILSLRAQLDKAVDQARSAAYDIRNHALPPWQMYPPYAGTSANTVGQAYESQYLREKLSSLEQEIKQSRPGRPGGLWGEEHPTETLDQAKERMKLALENETLKEKLHAVEGRQVVQRESDEQRFREEVMKIREDAEKRMAVMQDSLEAAVRLSRERSTRLEKEVTDLRSRLRLYSSSAAGGGASPGHSPDHPALRQQYTSSPGAGAASANTTSMFSEAGASNPVKELEDIMNQHMAAMRNTVAPLQQPSPSEQDGEKQQEQSSS
eukprot:Clim_evm13s242 gene=Clim_evmTU13s242